ncbi:MAG: tetratricopeptide repeat protein [Verrucomicrobia bacterium]|nr:tetratricopeptide repeat protein [Verrucomicrobiota bacterium]
MTVAPASLAVCLVFSTGCPPLRAAETNLTAGTNLTSAATRDGSEKPTSAKPGGRLDDASLMAQIAEQNRRDMDLAISRKLNALATELSDLKAEFKREQDRLAIAEAPSDQTTWMIVAGLASISLLVALGFGWVQGRSLRFLRDSQEDLRLRLRQVTEELMEHLDQQEQIERVLPPKAEQPAAVEKVVEKAESARPELEAKPEEKPAPPPPAPAPAPVPETASVPVSAPAAPPPAPVTVVTSKPVPAPEPVVQTPASTKDVPVAIVEPVPAPPEKISRAELMLGKGQTLLDLGQGDEAIACYDEAIALLPGNADALIKKGKALEQLQRFDQALHCFDLAIAADDSQANAYLLKAGVLTRLERHGEALKCYDLALRSRHKSLAA